MNYPGIWAIYTFEMGRTLRTLGQSIDPLDGLLKGADHIPVGSGDIEADVAVTNLHEAEIRCSRGCRCMFAVRQGSGDRSAAAERPENLDGAGRRTGQPFDPTNVPLNLVGKLPTLLRSTGCRFLRSDGGARRE